MKVLVDTTQISGFAYRGIYSNKKYVFLKKSIIKIRSLKLNSN